MDYMAAAERELRLADGAAGPAAADRHIAMAQVYATLANCPGGRNPGEETFTLAELQRAAKETAPGANWSNTLSKFAEQVRKNRLYDTHNNK